MVDGRSRLTTVSVKDIEKLYEALERKLSRLRAMLVEIERINADLTAAVIDEVTGLLGLTGAPRATAVTRWGRSLPQYRVGHRERVTRARASLPPGIAVAGAAWDGVGIPACIASGWAAADRVAGIESHG